MKQTVYVASPKSQEIHVWHLNAEGTLIPVQVINTPGQAQPMIIAPNKKFLYIGVRPKSRIITYRIVPNNGSLNIIEEFPLEGSPSYISIDHEGRFLFSASYTAGCINVIKLKNSIPVKTTDVVRGIQGCHSVNISPNPNNKTLWVPVLTQDCIYLFYLSENGKLNYHIPSKLKTIKGAGPRHLVFHPNHQYVYVINELNSCVDIWQVNNQNANIRPIQTIDMMPPDFDDTRWAADIHITPDGHYLYTCDRTSSMLTIFDVSKNGSKLQVKGFQATETQPRGFSIDTHGRFLIIAGQKTNHIMVYKIDIQGMLKAKGRYAVGQSPMWVLISDH